MDEIISGLRRRSAIPILVALFFISGATSLVYQTLWARELHLLFGTSQFAIATVLAAFMGGLAVGGFWMSRRADSMASPLSTYGILEIVIGLYALIFPPLLSLCSPIFSVLFDIAGSSNITFGLLQFIVVLTLLIIPTTCMGATLPLLARFVTTHIGGVGSRVGMLYGANTFGAVVGVWAAGFWLLPTLGLSRTLMIVVAANGILGISAIILSNWAGEGEAPAVESNPKVDEKENSDVKPILLIAATSGFAALVYEVAWFRLMALILGASTYAFSVMLLAFLLGIGSGGWIGGPAADLCHRRWKKAGVYWGLAVIQIMIGLSTFAMMWLYRDLPYLFVQLFDESAVASGLTWGRQIWLAILIMTPPALLMGATFPFMVRAATGGESSALGRNVGRIYGANTLGSLFGAVAAGFFLLPMLNVVGAVRVAVAANIIGALIAVFALTSSKKRNNRIIGSAIALASWIGIILTPPPWDPLLMTSGMYKYVSDLSGSTQENIDRFAVADFELLYYDEGYSSVVTVAQSRRSGNIWLANNGKVDASSTLDMPTQVLVAHLPFLFHNDPKVAAVIGLASGSTVGAATLHQTLEEIEAIELEPAIVQASHFFDDFNHRPLEDERVSLFLNDGRNHLLRSEEGRYDIIISEPSNPWITGVSNLFTREFFEMGKSRLAPGGVWSQWVQVYGMHPDDLRSILATFASVFPHHTLFATIEDSDLVLIGSESPLNLDIENVRAMIADPEIEAEMKIIDVNNEYDLLAYYRLDQDGLTQFIEGAVLNTDDNMRIEYSAPKHLHDATISDNLSALMRGHHVPALEEHEDLISLARAYGNHDDWIRGMIALQRIREADPSNMEAELLHRYYRRQFEELEN